MKIGERYHGDWKCYEIFSTKKKLRHIMIIIIISKYYPVIHRTSLKLKNNSNITVKLPIPKYKIDKTFTKLKCCKSKYSLILFAHIYKL